MNGWDKNPDGNIKVRPVMGYQTAAVAEIHPILQIEYADSQEALQKGEPSRFQVVMTVAQDRAIALALQRMADLCEKRPSGPAS